VLILVAVSLIINYQAKRIVIGLIESSAQDKIEVKIGTVNIQPVAKSIRVSDVRVLVRDPDSENFKQINVDRVFLDVASLWDFFLGGTLIIEKFECEGMNITLYGAKKQNSTSNPFDLTGVIQRIKFDAIRFQIEDIIFRNVSLTLSKDSTHPPATIKNIFARAQNLYLSTDSMLSKKPIVELYIPRQTITLPNELALSFDSLSFSTIDNSVQVLNLDLTSPPTDVHHVYHLKSDKVRLAHFNFESLYNREELVIDSVFLGKSNISVDWLIRQPERKDSVNQQGKLALPRIDIRSIAFRELASDVVIRKDSIRNTFNVEYASLTIDQFRYRPDSTHFIYAPSYNLLVTKYATSLGANNTSIRFDTIQIQKHSLSLLNFSYQTADQKQPLIQTPRFELKDVEWYEFLVNRKLVAQEVLVFDPTIVTTLKQNKDKAKKPIDRLSLVKSLSEFLQVNLFSLKNATAFVKVPDRQLDLVLRGYNTTFKVRDLVSSSSVNEGLNAVSDFSFKNLRVKNPTYRVEVENFDFGNKELLIKSLQYDAPESILMNLVGLRLGNVSWSEATNSITLDGLAWKSIRAEVKNSETKSDKAENTDEANLPGIHVTNIRGGNANLLFQNKELSVRTLFDHFNLNAISLTDSIKVKGIDIAGTTLLLNASLNEVRIGSYTLSDSGGRLNDISFIRNNEDPINVLASRFSFDTHLPDFARQKYVVNSLALDGLELRYNKRDSTRSLAIDAHSQLNVSDLTYAGKNISAGAAVLDIGAFDVISEKWEHNNEPELINTTRSGVRNFRMAADTLVQKNYSVKKITQTENQLRPAAVDSASSTLLKRTFRAKSSQGGIKINLNNIQSVSTDSAIRVKAGIKAIEFSEVDFTTDKLIAWINRGSLNNLVVDSEHSNDAWKVLEDNYPTAAVHNLKARIETNGNLFQFERLDYNPQSRSGYLSQFQFKPLKDKEQFLNESQYQTNYMDTRIESIAFNRFNVQRFLRDTVIELANIQLGSPNLEIGRDKTKPFLATAVKPLPTNALQKLKVSFKIDTLNVTDGEITYTEKSRITGQEGILNFNKMNAMVRNVKNIDLLDSDSLYIRASTRFMDSANVRLRVRESYRDTLAGFVLTSQVSPFHTSILNKALVPLVSVDFKSGYVDSLYMRAIGREYLSLGSMKFLYHDLKVEFMNKNDTSRHTLKNQLLKFAANTFVIRPNNTDRVGKVFYERDRNRAVFQYWVKMILSGVTTSVGAKSNKRQLKKYMKELNQKKLPPIEGDLDL
jgi:hypothetical protein